MCETGCRPKEAILLKDGDISFRRKVVILRTGKGGGSERKMPLTPTQMEWLKSIITERKERFPRAQYVFVDEHGEKIYRNRISDHVATARKAAKIKRQLVPYGNRHSFITRLQETDVAFGKIQALAGHKRADTTRGYTHLVDETLRNVMCMDEARRKRQA
jgi:integrase/recombinase XerD